MFLYTLVDFTQQIKVPLVDSWSHSPGWNQMYHNCDTYEPLCPAQDTLRHLVITLIKVAWQMVGKRTASFPFREWTQPNWTTQTWRFRLKSKATIFKVILEEKQQLVEEKDADNVRKILYKSFIQWFWELILFSYKYRVHCFDPLRLFFCCFSIEVKV